MKKTTEKSIAVLLICLLLLSSLTLPVIACPPPYCGDCEELIEGKCEPYGNCWGGCDDCYSCENCDCDWDCTTGQCCSGGECVDTCPDCYECVGGECVDTCPDCYECVGGECVHIGCDCHSGCCGPCCGGCCGEDECDCPPGFGPPGFGPPGFGWSSGAYGAAGSPTGGDPVFMRYGEYRLYVTDVSIRGRGLPVEITRTYGSRREYNSHFGYGWDMNYNLKVQRLDDPNTIVFLNGKGCGYEYTRDVSDPNKFVRSTRSTDYFAYDDANDTFALVRRDSIEYAFNANDNLSSITDETGSSITFGYDPNGLLTTITDDLDREISLSYNEDAFLETITDFADRTWEYYYDPCDTNDLIAVAGPTDLSTTYLYDANHNLEYIYDPCNQEVVRNYYNIDDKVWKQDVGEGSYEFEHNPTTNTTTITDREGFVTKMVYGDSGQLVNHTVYTADPNSDPNSFTTTYVYNSNLQRVRAVLPAGNCVDYTYDGSGNVTVIYRKTSPDDPNDPDDPNVIATIYTYDPNFVHKVKTITDAKGNVTTYDYNDLTGDLEKITYPAVTTPDGNESPVESFAYNDYGQIETITAPDEIVTKYEYYEDSNDPNNYGRLWKVIADANEADPNRLEITNEYEYDVLGRVIEVNDPNGDITQSLYNDLDQLVKTIAPSPFEYVTKFSYDINGNQSKIEREISGPNQITSFTYNVRNKLKEITDPLGYVTEYGYNKNEDPNLITDAEDHNTVAEYNERRLLRKVTDASGGTTEYSYDDNGNLTEIKDANSNTTTYVYDDFDRLETITYPDDTNEVFGYDKNSSIASKKNRKGETIYYEHDALNRMIVKNRPGDPNITYLYDIAGRVVDINDGGDVTTYSYDRIGRVEDVNDTESRIVSYEHDKRGHRTKLVYPDNSYITYRYDTMSRLTKIIDDSNNVLAQYTYDDLSRRTLVTLGNDANAVYEYDLGNRLKKLTNNLDDTNSIVFDYNDYDKVGNRLSMKVDDANAHIYTYDKLYQLINVDYNDGSITSYYYDSLGNRTDVVDGNGVIGYWKMDDNADNTTVVDSSGNGYNGTFNDAGGDPDTSAHHTNGKIGGALGFDGDDDYVSLSSIAALEGNTVTISAWVNAYDVDTGRHPIVSTLYSEDHWYGYFLYLASNKPTFYLAGKWAISPDPISDHDWYHLAGTYDGSELKIYVNGELKDTNSVSGLTGFYEEYNNTYIGYEDVLNNHFEGKIDNVMIFDRALPHTEYARNSLNQYTSVDGTDYSYDDSGNLTDDGTYDYYYDCENRLMDVNDANGQRVATYSYDYNGRRIYKTINGTITNYCYDGDQVIVEYDPNDTLLRKFVYGPGIDEPICMIDVTDSNAVYFYHYDGLGSVIALSDSQNPANIVERYSYDVFGEPTIRDANNSVLSVSSVANPYYFTGRRYNTETGLYYYRARYYAHDIGRFLQTDPVGYGDGLNLYTYVRNNPINLSDPSGLLSHTSGCVLYTSCCLFMQDLYACGAQVVCMIAGNNCWSNCVRNCLLSRYQCNQPFWETNAEHAYCYAVCTARSLF